MSTFRNLKLPIYQTMYIRGSHNGEVIIECHLKCFIRISDIIYHFNAMEQIILNKLFMKISYSSYSIFSLRSPVRMIPKSESSLIFCFLKNSQSVVLQKFICVFNENGIIMSRRHSPGNFRPFHH